MRVIAMASNLFINEFMTVGMNDYFYSDSTSSFERHIIECLVDICGAANIKKCFDDRDENAFYSLLTKYCTPTDLYNQLLHNCVNFEKYKKNNSVQRGNVYASYIEIILIKMFLRKSVMKTPSLEEVSHFENDLLNNFEMIKWHLSNSDNPNRTREEWNLKKRILESDVELIEIKPQYLDAFTYAKYGADLEKVKQMDYRMVNELNAYIQERIFEDQKKEASESQNQKRLKLNTAVSSGNGFVDALLIVSIIATELSVGLIYLFLHL